MIQAAVPYVVSWDNVAIQVLHANVSTHSIPKLLNMSLVGLGQIQDEKTPKNEETEIVESVIDSKNENHDKIALNPGAKEFTPGSAIENPKEIEPTRECPERKTVGLKPPKLLSKKGKATKMMSIRHFYG